MTKGESNSLAYLEITRKVMTMSEGNIWEGCGNMPTSEEARGRDMLIKEETKRGESHLSVRKHEWNMPLPHNM